MTGGSRPVAALALALAVLAMDEAWLRVTWLYGGTETLEEGVGVYETEVDLVRQPWPWITGLAVVAAMLLLLVWASARPGHEPFRMPAVLRLYLGDVLLALTGLGVLFAALVGEMSINGRPASGAVLALCGLLPLVSMSAWRRGVPLGWGGVAAYAMLGLWLYDAGGPLLFIGLIPFALGNLLWSWPDGRPAHLALAGVLLALAALSCILWPAEDGPYLLGGGAPFWGSRTRYADGDNLAMTEAGEPGPGWWLAWAAALLSLLACWLARRAERRPRSEATGPAPAASPGTTGK